MRIISNSDHSIDDIADNGRRRCILPGSAPDKNRRSRDISGKLNCVVNAVHASERFVERNKCRINAERKCAGFEITANHAEQLNAIAEIARTMHVFERNVANAFDECVALRNPFSVREKCKNNGFVKRIPAVEVESVIRFDIAEFFRILQNFFIRLSFRFHAGKDVIAGSVDNSRNGFESICDQPFAKRFNNRNPAGTGRFKIIMTAERFDELVRPEEMV